MNFYDLHSNPEKLLHYRTRNVSNPHIFFKRLGITTLAKREAIIAKHPKFAYLYAVKANKRFELGEPAIATNGLYSSEYAEYILKGPFELGEPAIAKDARYSYQYAKNVLKGKRFEMGEPAIAKNGWYSYVYAEDIIKGRFKLGEPAVITSIYKSDYEKRFKVKL